jgi:hypothetical protein
LAGSPIRIKVFWALGSHRDKIRVTELPEARISRRSHLIPSRSFPLK